MSDLKREKSFENFEIEEDRILMLNAWDNFQETDAESTSEEVKRVQRVLRNAHNNKDHYPLFPFV